MSYGARPSSLWKHNPTRRDYISCKILNTPALNNISSPNAPSKKTSIVRMRAFSLYDCGP